MTAEKTGAYAAHQRTQENSRETDARALLSCAGRLKAALDNGGADMEAYTNAIRHNQRLWTIFQVALCDPENPLPRDLKVTLLNLSRYIDRVSFRAMGSFTPELLTGMININRTVASGLSVKPRVETTPMSAVETAPSGPAVVMTTV